MQVYKHPLLNVTNMTQQKSVKKTLTVIPADCIINTLVKKNTLLPSFTYTHNIY